MIFGEKETDIIEHLQLFYMTGLQRIALLPSPNPELENILDKVCNQEKWNNWVNSADKSAPPPDFYSDEFKIMLDVMRVNDHEHKGKKGKLYNPSMAHERQMLKELEQSGILAQFPGAKVFLNGDTQLPTYEDHNYNLYLKCFRRVISKHIDSIPLYQKNHPGYKVIFLVFDESSAYFESEQPIDTKKQLQKGEGMSGRPHFFFLDDDFLNAFIDKGIDYLFWYTPYKLFEYITPPLELPTLCVYDLTTKQIQCKTYTYDSRKMSSVEI
ncbi:MAG: hypothetical protein K2H82_01945 [Oscillospiraceae bacterium]|nr:hypothetical protein [Oscillospiraceae bacterium]